MPSVEKISSATVRDDFNAINTVLHYTRAAHFIGLWKSELALIERYFPDKTARLLEAGCGAGRVAVGLWHQGYRDITAFDFASELVEQAVNLAQEQGIAGITFLQADATDPELCNLLRYKFDGVVFMFNGLMQIPGRENRRAALRELHRVCRPGAHFVFTTHDRDDPADVKEWAKEAERWARGEQNPRLLEFGDRYFTDENGNTFMHLPDRKEVLEDMAATGWTQVQDNTRNELASETPKVRNFSDNCRFWVAQKNRADSIGKPCAASNLDPIAELTNTFVVIKELSKEAALHFAQELRNARAKALADAEGWQELIFVFERLAKFMTACQKTDLGTDEAERVFQIIACGKQGDIPLNQHGFKLLFQQVVYGRNSEFHGGAAARRFARHCVEFSFLLEQGLTTFMNKNLGSVMSSPVSHVETWQMLADVRRLMLENSFTWVPVKHDKAWRVISDHALVRFLEKHRSSLLTKTVGEVLPESGSLEAPVLKIFDQNTETHHKELLEALTTGPVLVSTELQSPDRVVGIVTAFDLL